MMITMSTQLTWVYHPGRIFQNLGSRTITVLLCHDAVSLKMCDGPIYGYQAGSRSHASKSHTVHPPYPEAGGRESKRRGCCHNWPACVTASTTLQTLSHTQFTALLANATSLVTSRTGDIALVRASLTIGNQEGHWSIEMTTAWVTCVHGQCQGPESNSPPM